MAHPRKTESSRRLVDRRALISVSPEAVSVPDRRRNVAPRTVRGAMSLLSLPPHCWQRDRRRGACVLDRELLRGLGVAEFLVKEPFDGSALWLEHHARCATTRSARSGALDLVP